MARGTSRSYLNPDLVKTLEQGISYTAWLGNRIPGIGYLRISSDMAVRKSKARVQEVGKGVRHQREEVEEDAALHNVAIVRFYEDNNITAADPEIERPSFREAVSHLMHRRTPEGYYVNACVAVEHERVWRLPEDYIAFRRALGMKEDGLFIERKQPYDIASVGGNILGLVNAGVSEGEVKKTKERVAREVRRLALDGESPGGTRRYGWLDHNIKEGRKANMALHPEEAEHLRKMIDDALTEMAWTTVADRANSRGSRTTQGNLWTGATVRQLLINPRNCGYRDLGGSIVRHPTTQEPIIGKWEAICTPAEWERLQGLTQKRGSKSGFRPRAEQSRQVSENGRPALDIRTRKYLFSGFLRCGAKTKSDRICGERIKGSRRPTKKNPNRFVYVCTTCNSIGRSGEHVDRHLEALVLAALEKRYAQTSPKKTPWTGKKMLAHWEEKQRTLEANWMADVVDDATYFRLNQQIAEQIQTLQQDRQEFLTREAAKNALAGWERSKWDSMTLAQKRAVIGHVIQAVIILPIPDDRLRSAPFDPNLLRIIPW